jgi:hypothetical protein
LPVELLAGSYVELNSLWQAIAVKPADVGVQYTLRVDVLQSHNFTLHTGIQPPESKWMEDYFGWAESFWTSLLAGWNPFSIFGDYAPLVAFLFLIGIIVFAIVIIVWLRTGKNITKPITEAVGDVGKEVKKWQGKKEKNDTE